ncbi:MAG: hypothetical protein ACRDRN_24865, partial [Sciscionella sp.]
RQVTDEFDLGYVSSFMLNNVPVLSLTSVTRIDGSITWDLASLHVNQKSGQVTLLSGAPVSGLVAVTYQAGYTVVPPNFQLAARIIVQHLWMTQRGDKGATRAGGMGTSVVPGIGFAIPNRALELLGTGLPGIA